MELSGVLSTANPIQPTQHRTSCTEQVETRRAKPQAEGKRILEPIKGKLAGTLIEMEQDVQSSTICAGKRQLFRRQKTDGHP